VSGSRSPLQRIYDRHDRLPEMREALQLYENHLASIINSEEEVTRSGITGWLRRRLV
jgi:hypothetical protein